MTGIERRGLVVARLGSPLPGRDALAWAGSQPPQLVLDPIDECGALPVRRFRRPYASSPFLTLHVAGHLGDEDVHILLDQSLDLSSERGVRVLMGLPVRVRPGELEELPSQ